MRKGRKCRTRRRTTAEGSFSSCLDIKGGFRETGGDGEGRPAFPAGKGTDDGKRLLSAFDAEEGKDLSMVFLHEEAMISDDRKLFRQIEGFQMTEDIFGYICSSRVRQYPGCSEWELSAYENSEINGCITNGVFVRENGRNVLSDLAFAVTVLGEDRRMQKFNPYVFSYTEALSGDNDDLISSIMNMKKTARQRSNTTTPTSTASSTAT